MDDPRLLLDLFNTEVGDNLADPVDLYGGGDIPQMSWQNQSDQQTGYSTQNLSRRIQEVLGAREPDQGGIATDILSSRFSGGGGGSQSYGNYAQGVIQSALGKPQIAPPSSGDSDIFKTLSLLSSISNQQANSDFRNKQFQETMRHNQAVESLAGQRINTSGNKPLPPTAIKLQNEGLDIIGTSNGINADLNALIGQIDQGKLSLNPVGNTVSRGLNWAGLSNEESRNFDSFQRTLEKMRNDSLRLNKGVQTEGDAQRAWNEILANINDEQLVKERLKEVMALNSRAADLQKLNVDNIRANYGHDPLDYTQYENRPAAIGAGATTGGIKFLGFEEQ